MRSLIAGLKLTAVMAWSLLLVPPQVILLKFTTGPKAYLIPNLWEKGIATIFQIKVNKIGKALETEQVFFVGNHLSHFDIPTLGYLSASFIAKDDIAKWPVFGFLSRLQQTAFISRSAKDASTVKNNVGSMIEQGKSIIIFPEGTSTRGTEVLDFKSSLFAIALDHADKGLKIQPFTLELLKVDGKAANTKEIRDIYAWDRDNPIEIGTHIWNFAKTKGAELNLHFHDAVTPSPNENRKELAARIRTIVAQPLTSALN